MGEREDKNKKKRGTGRQNKDDFWNLRKNLKIIIINKYENNK